MSRTVLHTFHVLLYSEFITTLQGNYYNHLLQIRKVFQRGCKPGLLTLKPLLLTNNMLPFDFLSFVLMKRIYQVLLLRRAVPSMISSKISFYSLPFLILIRLTKWFVKVSWGIRSISCWYSFSSFSEIILLISLKWTVYDWNNYHLLDHQLPLNIAARFEMENYNGNFTKCHSSLFIPYGFCFYHCIKYPAT